MIVEVYGGRFPESYKDLLSLPGVGDYTAGAIASIASLLAESGISIKNIGIIHNRDFEEGVLRVEFYEQSSLEEAITLLKSLHYSIYQRK